jgi:hypothetical protein
VLCVEGEMNARSEETDGMWRARCDQEWRPQLYVVSCGVKAVQNAVAIQTVEQVKSEGRGSQRCLN